MRCSKCAAERPETSSLRGPWGLRCSIPLSSLALTALALVAVIEFTSTDTCAREDPELVRLAAAKFPSLTHAERAMLEFAQAGNVERGQFAQAGLSANPNDPSNDPKGADEW